MLLTTSKNEHKMLRWFTNYADADRYSEGLSYFEDRDTIVKEVSSDRFEVYEITNLNQ